MTSPILQYLKTRKDLTPEEIMEPENCALCARDDGALVHVAVNDQGALEDEIEV